MTTYIALLRGINVSGHRLIKMAELKRMCEGMGLKRVQTYIQSGNILFESEAEEPALAAALEAEIMRVFGFEVPVIIRSAAEWEVIVASCPFPELREGESIYVSLLPEEPPAEGVERLRAYEGPLDEFRVQGRELYFLHRQPVHQSKLANSVGKLGVPSTSRNWQTMNKLLALARAMANP